MPDPFTRTASNGVFTDCPIYGDLAWQYLYATAEFDGYWIDAWEALVGALDG